MTEGRLLGGRYRLERLIGRGGMAEVYAARDEVLDRVVAVKVLSDRFVEDEDFLARFRREAQAAAGLNHPNIVAVYDTGEDAGRPYIVMELVRGRSLQQAIRAGGLTEDRALEVCAEVCAALAYAHSRGLVHRDVKPGNILLADDGSVKVTDFGIARAVDADTVTQTAAILGTAAYLSPEQAQGQSIDTRSDLYSLGVVLYETLTGEQPFQGDTPVTVAYQHVQEQARAPREWDATITTAAEAIAMRALAKNPANRYATAEHMQQDLLNARVGRPVAAPPVLQAEDTALLDAVPTNRSTRPESAQRRRRILGFVMLGLLTVAATAAAVLYIGSLFGGEEAQRLTVPNVTGMTFEEARETLDSKGFVARYERDEYSSEVEDGRIIRQTPVQGRQEPEGTVVRVVISRGRELVFVPALTGMTESEAAAKLRQIGLVPGERITEFDEDVEKGIVIRTRPSAEERVVTGSQVDLVISAGRETVRVLRVEGLTESDATFQLEDQGFEVLVVREFSESVEEGVVIRQNPEPGTQLETGADVTIVVSRGPQEEPSPSPTDDPSPEPSPTDEPSPGPSPTDEPSPSDEPSPVP